jgi:DNA-binding transcriptional MerR regulator
MARKRAWRPDLRKHRVRRPAATDGWGIAELAKLVTLSPQTIKSYVRRGLLAKVEFRGTATRYPRGHLLRLLAIRYLQLEGPTDFLSIRRQLDAWAPADLEAWVLKRTARPDVLEALRGSAAASARALEAAASLPPPRTPFSTEHLALPGAAPTASPFAAQAWQRVELLPGLELQLRSDAGPLARRMAERLYAAFTDAIAG